MDVTDNRARSRYEMPLEDGQMAYVDYREDGDRLLLTYAKVPPAHEGKGVAARMVRAVLEDVRARGQKAVPVCGYIVAFARRHPEFNDVVVAA